MANVIVNKDKIDLLANAISDKSKEPVTMTLDEMVEAVDSIETPNLQKRFVTVVPKVSANTVVVTPDAIHNGMDEVEISVSAMPTADISGPTTTWSTSSGSAGSVSNYYKQGANYARIYIGSIPTTPIVYRDGYVNSVASSNRSVTWDTQYKFNPALTVAGAKVTVPSASFYTGGQSATVQTGTEGDPVATKGTVTNNSVTVTPSVTNTEGYIDGGSHTGTPVTVTASELVSGTKSITQNGTGIDVTNYASVDVSVSSQAPSLQAKTNITPTESSQTITADNGYDGLSSVQINAISSSYVGSGITRRDVYDLTASGSTVTVPSGYYTNGAQKSVGTGTAKPAASISASAATVSVGTNTIMLSKTAVSNTPQVTAGYISSGTAGDTDVSLTASVNTRSSSDLTVSGAQITAPAGYYASSASKSVPTASFTGPEIVLQTGATISTVPSSGTLILKKLNVNMDVTSTGGYVGNNVNVTAAQIQLRADCAINPALTASGATVTAPAGYYSSDATKTISSGTAGTPTATKGTVSNHSISVTPSVTNTTGYITGSTINGTAVTVSASELVSGSQTLSDNGTYNVTNLAEVVVDVQGGSSGGAQVATKTTTPSTAASSIQFTSLSGNPTSFVVTSQEDIATNTNGITAVVFDGSSLHGQTMTSQVEADTGFTKSYSNGTLTITATSAQFQANSYKLVYTYGGSASDIETADVQVGSGATSITFSVNGRPAYWSCIFKSDFSTSSGYQRVIAVANDGSSTYGLAMDSSANVQTSWTASYSGGNFTINSQSTNNGGYFHQPGYYQLTYAVDDSAPSYQTKSVYATTSAQTITADNGYDALEQVNLGAISQTNLTAGNIKSGTTISISNGSTNLWSVTGTYSGDGGGGSSRNAQSAQSTTRSTSTSYTEVVALTCAVAGTYDVYWTTFRSSTSGTWGSQLYINDAAYGSAQTGSWSNHVQNIHLSNVSLSANADVAVRVRSRGNSYYGYVGTLTIIQSS